MGFESSNHGIENDSKIDKLSTSNNPEIKWGMDDGTKAKYENNTNNIITESKSNRNDLKTETDKSTGEFLTDKEIIVSGLPGLEYYKALNEIGYSFTNPDLNLYIGSDGKINLEGVNNYFLEKGHKVGEVVNIYLRPQDLGLNDNQITDITLTEIKFQIGEKNYSRNSIRESRKFD